MRKKHPAKNRKRDMSHRRGHRHFGGEMMEEPEQTEYRIDVVTIGQERTWRVTHIPSGDCVFKGISRMAGPINKIINEDIRKRKETQDDQ